MLRKDAIKLARGLRADGKTLEEIADKLAEEGFLSNRKKPLSIGGVSSLLMRATPKKKKQKKARRSRGGSDRAMLEICLRLLNNKAMSPGRPACSVFDAG